jgi:hypothetical protein
MLINSKNHPAAMAGLLGLLGADITRFEATVFHLASQLTVDHPEEGITRYRGGNWTLEAVTAAGDGSSPLASYGWRLESTERFRYLNTLNGCEATVDAELLSLAINLIATSQLCIWHFQRGHEQLNHVYAVLHEGLKQYCLEHLQTDAQRLAQFLAMID